MTAFVNGHKYATAIALAPPGRQDVPWIQVRIGITSSSFKPVVGKFDTGASMTFLSFSTGGIIGLGDPKTGCIRSGEATAANGESFPYFVHSILVKVPGPNGRELTFPLEAGFAKALPHNLFGIDWLRHVCVAADEDRIHLLRD